MSLEKAQIPYQKDGQDIVSLGAYRVLETFDEAADEWREPIRDDIRAKMKRALTDFPELAHRAVTVGRMDPDADAAGRARFWNLMVLFPVDRVTSFTTVYHELAHLAIHIRNERGEDVPITSEEFCGIFGVARMPTELIDEDRVPYLGEPSVPKEEWPEICERALEYREDHHDYIKQCEKWLGVSDS